MKKLTPEQSMSLQVIAAHTCKPISKQIHGRLELIEYGKVMARIAGHPEWQNACSLCLREVDIDSRLCDKCYWCQQFGIQDKNLSNYFYLREISEDYHKRVASLSRIKMHVNLKITWAMKVIHDLICLAFLEKGFSRTEVLRAIREE